MAGRRIPADVAVRGLRSLAGPSTRKALSGAMREVSKEGKDRVAREWRRQRIKPSVANRVVGRRATQTSAKVSLRTDKYPYAAGVAFGALAYRQFPRWVGNARTAATWEDMHLLGPELVDLAEGDGPVIFADAMQRLMEEKL